MYSHLLYDNEQKRKEAPLWMLLCFVMFTVWQMGIIYYIGPALNIDGRTPLPISPDNLTTLIVAGYVCSIICLIAIPKAVIWLCRISTAVALIAAIGLFFPLGTTILTSLIYIQCFCCCYMIGFESATMAHYLTGNSVTKHLLIAYPIGYTLVAFIQNDFITISFSTFRILMVIMLVLLFIFYLKMPVKGNIRFVKKSDNLIRPKRFLTGFLLLAFLSALLGVIAPAAAAEVKHGVFVAYLSCAIGSAFLYLLYKKTGRHPICFVSYIIGISAIGYVLLAASSYISGIGLIACGFIGVGMSACALLPLFSLLVVKQYPSHLIVPGYIALAMLAVIVQSVLVEAFRSSSVLLNLSYLMVVIILTIVFVLFEPFLLYSIRRKFEEEPIEDVPVKNINNFETSEIADERKLENVVGLDLKLNNNSDSCDSTFPENSPIPSKQDTAPLDTPDYANSLAALTKRELEIVNLISLGHSNKDIAKILFISENTAKDHTKNIYKKLDVHSRYELMALMNRIKDKEL